MDETTVDAQQFRDVLGHFPTGVAVITAETPSGPAGMTVQSFMSLSLSPPLILLSVSKTSTTWPKIQAGEGLAISILSQFQGPLARQFASKSPDKFAGVHVSTGVHTGSPILSDSSAWVEARIRNIYDGGDHHIVVCSVLDLQINQELGMHRQPLLFFRAAFSRLAGHATPYPHTPAGEALRASPSREGAKTEQPLPAETRS
ncbi:flavin reductase family protein [Streptomyces sp. NPDC051572]|uniref:flavin reductase family protein n=1 Tax=unclassified Streptomyces TaxID=2593676 RepID=UPI00344C798E